MGKNILIAVVALVVGIVIGAAVKTATTPVTTTGGVTFEDETFLGDVTISGTVSSADLTASDDLTVTDDVTVSGKVTVAGHIVNTTDSITATTTLTGDSSTLQLLGASAEQVTITLPAATAGYHFTFVVTGALTGPTYLIDSAEGDNIEGILMVNDADVVCSGEDQLNIITDGEVVGDRVEIVSDGTSWYIMDSDVDAAGKMTCTDPS